MKRNVKKGSVKTGVCVLLGALLLTGYSVSADAAVSAGVSGFADLAARSVRYESQLLAGVSSSFMRVFREASADITEENSTLQVNVGTKDLVGQAQFQEEEPKIPEEETEVTTEETQEETKEETETPSEFANIGVSNVSEDSYINIRSKASVESSVVGKLYSKSAVTVLGEEGEFYRIHSGRCEGYIKKQYIITGDEELAKSISTRTAIVEVNRLNIREDQTTDGRVLGQVNEGDRLLVVQELDGWVEVFTDEGQGFVSADYVRCRNFYKVAESKEEEQERLAREAAARRGANRNTSSQSTSGSSKGDTGAAKTYAPPSGSGGVAVANYASQFVGNPYVYGGESLTNGADCSGFVKSVYAAFGVSLPHSSSALRGVGYGVSASEMQPGDIICYRGHVGIYIGNNTIVHASSPSTGIKFTSPANYKQILAVRRIF